jgi:hypothetical protein
MGIGKIGVKTYRWIYFPDILSGRHWKARWPKKPAPWIDPGQSSQRLAGGGGARRGCCGRDSAFAADASFEAFRAFA